MFIILMTLIIKIITLKKIVIITIIIKIILVLGGELKYFSV